MASAAGLTGLAGGAGGVERGGSTAAEAALGTAVVISSVEALADVTRFAHGALSVVDRFHEDDDEEVPDDRCTAEVELDLAACM
jgi:hypothetical protein